MTYIEHSFDMCVCVCVCDYTHTSIFQIISFAFLLYLQTYEIFHRIILKFK